MNEHKRYLEAAYTLAVTSQDPSTQLGSILVGSNFKMGGWNYVPAEALEPGESMASIPRERKIEAVIHAEKAPILRCAAAGLRTKDAVLYCTWYACQDCANCIALAGIKEVVGHRLMLDNAPARWLPSVTRGLKTLERSKVKCTWIDDLDIDPNFSIRFDGRNFFPGNGGFRE